MGQGGIVNGKVYRCHFVRAYYASPPSDASRTDGRRFGAWESPLPTHHHHPQGKGPLSRERVLEVLLEYEDGARQKELTERLHLNPSTMSEMIDKLEGSGYLKRTIDASDKRATLISLTDLGHSRALEIQDEKEEKIRPLFANLTEEEKQELIRLINKLITPVEAL